MIQIKLALHGGPLNFKIEVPRGWRKRDYLGGVMRANPLITNASIVTRISAGFQYAARLIRLIRTLLGLIGMGASGLRGAAPL